MQQKWILEGLSCANCALKIVDEINRAESVEAVNLNFATGEMVISTKTDEGFDRARTIIRKIEPDIRIRDGKGRAQEEKTGSLKGNVARLIAGAVLLGVGMIFTLDRWAELTLFLISYLVVGYDILLKSVKNIGRGKIFDENFLMSVATIGAFAVGEYPEGASVMLFYQVGELFQARAVNHSRASITKLMDIRPDYANLYENGKSRGSKDWKYDRRKSGREDSARRHSNERAFTR